MPSGNWWPSMSCTIDVWKGDENGIRWITDGDPFAVYRSSTDWNGRGFRRNASSTCREIMSNDIRSIADSWRLLFNESFDSSIKKRVTLTIHKEPPAPEWMSVWRALWAFPGFVRSYKSGERSMKFVLDNHFISIGAPQPIFSFPFFFVNRHDLFDIEVLANVDKVIDQLLTSGEEAWSGGSNRGSYGFAHAFAAYVMNIQNNKQAFEKIISCNGVGSYVYDELIQARPKTLAEFVSKYKIDVNYVRNYTALNGMSVGQILAGIRSSQNAVVPTAW